MANRQRIYSNPLAYPAGLAPMFDPRHLAAVGMGGQNGFSGVSLNGTFNSVLTGIKPTLVGSGISAGCYGPTGPLMLSDGTLTGYSFATTAVTPTVVTCAAIVWIGDPLGVYGSVFSLNGNSLSFLITSALLLRAQGSTGSAISSNAKVSLSAPYFVVWSVSGSVAYFLTKNLLTGKTIVETVSSTAAFANATAAYYVGAPSNGFAAIKNGIAAVMYNRNIQLSPPQLLLWAADPWSFWYGHNYVGAAAAAGGFIPAWVMQSNLPVIGAGVY